MVMLVMVVILARRVILSMMVILTRAVILTMVAIFVMIVTTGAPKGLFEPRDEAFQFRRREPSARMKRTVIPQRHFSVANHICDIITVLVFFATPLGNV